MYTVHSFNNDKAYNGNFGRSNSSALLLHYFAQHFLLFPRVNPYVKFNILLKLKLKFANRPTTQISPETIRS